jgi:formylmethanofuran dehydrogenase subunit E
MDSRLSKETIDRVIGFHGHSCPGLRIGIRVSGVCSNPMLGATLERK